MDILCRRTDTQPQPRTLSLSSTSFQSALYDTFCRERLLLYPIAIHQWRTGGRAGLVEPRTFNLDLDVDVDVDVDRTGLSREMACLGGVGVKRGEEKKEGEGSVSVVGEEERKEAVIDNSHLYFYLPIYLPTYLPTYLPS